MSPRPAPFVPSFVTVLERFPLWTTGLVLLIAGCLIYTYAGTVSRETYRTTWLPENSVPFTLDGMAFMKVAYPADYAGINWLNAHVAGAQVIAEADDSYYNWRSRVSMFTGLPTIINGIHEPEQRYGDEIDPTSLCGQTANPSECLAHTHARSDDLRALYGATSPAEKWRVIHTYGVRYIYVGFSERQLYPHAGLDAFTPMVGKGLTVAFQRPGVTIYRVTG
jgi:uncharacterized membrane protein